jgi:hypothetical protein
MWRRLRTVALVLLAVVLLAVGYAAYVFFGEGFRLVITEAELKSAVAGQFPITKTHLAVIEVTYSDPVIILPDGSDRVVVGMTATPSIPLTQRLAGIAQVSGALDYRRETGEFFLTGIRVEKLEISGLSERYATMVRGVTSVALKEYFDAHPVYALQSADTKQSMAKLVLKSVTIRDRTLVVTMGGG